MSPIPYRFGFCRCPASLTAGLLTVPLFRRFAAIFIKDNNRAAAKCTAVLGLAFFFLSLIFARSPTDATSRLSAGVASQVSRYAPAVSLATGGSVVSCMPCKMSCTCSRLSSSLVSAVSLLVRRPPQHGHRCNKSPCCPAALAVLRPRQSFSLWLPQPQRHRSTVLKLLDFVFRRLLLCPLIIILLISGIFRPPAPSL